MSEQRDQFKKRVEQHENDATPEPMTIAEARARLQTYLSGLPEEWG